MKPPGRGPHTGATPSLSLLRPGSCLICPQEPGGGQDQQQFSEEEPGAPRVELIQPALVCPLQSGRTGPREVLLTSFSSKGR